MSEEQQRIFIQLYLNWYNNYVSIAGFANDVGLSYSEAKSVLEIGKRLHEASTTTQRMVQNRVTEQS